MTSLAGGGIVAQRARPCTGSFGLTTVLHFRQYYSKVEKGGKRWTRVQPSRYVIRYLPVCMHVCLLHSMFGKVWFADTRACLMAGASRLLCVGW